MGYARQIKTTQLALLVAIQLHGWVIKIVYEGKETSMKPSMTMPGRRHEQTLTYCTVYYTVRRGRQPKKAEVESTMMRMSGEQNHNINLRLRCTT